MRLIYASLFAIMLCGFGCEDDHPPPAGQAGSVYGTAVDVYHGPNSTTMRPHDLSAAGLSALVPGAGGTLVEREPVTTAEGSFTFADVPSGAFFLRFTF